jgi:plasmid stability protein
MACSTPETHRRQAPMPALFDGAILPILLPAGADAMGIIHIENVDEQIMKSIRLRARSSGRSFEEEVRALLAEAAKPRMTREDFVAEALRIQAMTPKGVKQTDSTEIVRELRDNGYAGR